MGDSFGLGLGFARWGLLGASARPRSPHFAGSRPVGRSQHRTRRCLGRRRWPDRTQRRNPKPAWSALYIPCLPISMVTLRLTMAKPATNEQYPVRPCCGHCLALGRVARQQKLVALEGSVGSFTIEALVSPELQTSATMRDPKCPQRGAKVYPEVFPGQFKLIGSSDSYLI